MVLWDSCNCLQSYNEASLRINKEYFNQNIRMPLRPQGLGKWSKSVVSCVLNIYPVLSKLNDQLT